MTPTDRSSFTGFERKRTSSRSVLVGDRIARWFITVGGMGTIVAVALVCVFLVWVVVPLFGRADVEAGAVLRTPANDAGVARQIVDPYLQYVVQVRRDGRATMIGLADGATLASHELFDPSAAASLDVVRAGEGRYRAFVGTTEGSVLPIEFELAAGFVAVGDLPPAVRALEPGRAMVHDGVLLERTDAGGRRHTLTVAAEPAIPLGSEPIVALDVVVDGGDETVLALERSGRLHLQRVTHQEDLLGGEPIVETTGSSRTLAELGVVEHEQRGQPDHVLLPGSGGTVLLVWNDGATVRLDTRDLEQPAVAERLDLLPEPDARITAVEFLIGNSTLLVGDDRGRVRSFFRSRPNDVTPRGSDGSQLEFAREFLPGPAAVLSLDASGRSRTFLTAFADGTLRLFNATTERLLAETRAGGLTSPLRFASLAPQEDGIVAVADDQLQRIDLDLGHTEVTLGAIFLPVHYEGSPTRAHVWQTTGGSDDFEPKYGLWPLMFGTLKATLYCLLFGVPLALLAAIYTSEFLHPRTRLRVKPVVELMASLPSVVLGFLAALVFAPVIERHLVTLLAAFATLPLVWLVAAQLLQMLAPRQRLAAEGRRLWLVALSTPIAVGLAFGFGHVYEALFFGGDFKQWLSQDDAQATAQDALGGWLMVTLPVGAFAATIAMGRVRWFMGSPVGGLLRLAIGCAMAAAIGLVLGEALALAGMELRGTIVGTYVQRNALVVGIVMGFAVIPIIYTIAEDALSAVPEHLRAASLGAGATQWQTATRIILPTAMSGIFSAIMVGLGRAVGETMIVLMATGGTPILDLNVFNGFETLSQAIAIELPEAAPHSTHYRMLYFAALVLFAFTFVLNTIAEVVRQRFRRRAWQL